MRAILVILFLTFSWVPSTALERIDPPIYTVSDLMTEFTYQYEGKERGVPLKIYHPEITKLKKFPVILMSHGLGGSREVGSYLGQYWAERGFVVVAMEHDGSDIDILEGKQRKEYVRAFKKALSLENFLNRVHDVSATIDQISKWNTVKSHDLYGMLNLKQIGMCGHSFGAVTTQAVSGQSFPSVGQKYTDKRIKAAFAMSPSSSRMKIKQKADAAKKAFGDVQLPWLLMTGTDDKVFLAPHVNVENRKKVFANLPDGDKYQLVLDEATHMAFSDKTMRGRKHKNPEHHKDIKTISTAFFKAYLANDKKAKVWLQSGNVSKILNAKDEWETK